MGGCQNYGSFLWVPIILRHLFLGYPKKDQNFDSHQHVQVARQTIGIDSLGNDTASWLTLANPGFRAQGLEHMVFSVLSLLLLRRAARARLYSYCCIVCS